jgi:hypothetical protein
MFYRANESYGVHTSWILLSTPCTTPLNPPLVRGEEYELTPSPL